MGGPTLRPPTGRQAGGVPVYGFSRVPGRPPISVQRLRVDEQGVPAAVTTAHAHAFLVVAFFERGGGRLRVDDGVWDLADGDVVVIAPGEVVGPEMIGLSSGVSAWTAFFPADAVDVRAGAGAGAWSWRAHPLLAPFVGHAAGGAQLLRVPPEERAGWADRFAALDRELTDRRPGFDRAAEALLTLVLVDLARLAEDVRGHLRLRGEPLLAAVFDVSEQRYAEPISLREVAEAVGLSAPHLTTVVGRRTGRTVLQWLTERRMTEARRLLADGDLPVTAIAARVGYRDPRYFIRRFRALHGVPPQEWRRAAR